MRHSQFFGKIMKLRIFILIVLQIIFFACSKKSPENSRSTPTMQGKETDESFNNNQSPDQNISSSVNDLSDTTESFASKGFGLVRLTPEQLSNSIYTALGYRLGRDKPNGEFIDRILTNYNISLGGIDFEIAKQRDFSTRAQTVLLVRIIAWEAAVNIISKERSLPPNERVLFTKCNLEIDRPFGSSDSALSANQQETIKEQEGRWQEQVKDLFLRLYARQPSNEEMEIIKQAFHSVYMTEGKKILRAWMSILYGLLSAEEFWNI